MMSHPFSDEALTRARAYQRERHFLFFAHQLLSAGLLAILLGTGLSVLMRAWAVALAASAAGQVFFYLAFFFLFSFAFEWPFSYLAGYRLEKRYGLSNETLSAWLWRTAKKNALSFGFGVLVVEAFYFLIRTRPERWWLYAWGFWILVTLLVGRLLPVLIVPIFYRYKPLSAGAVRDRILRLAAGYGLPIENIYGLDLSKTTKKANAAFLGLGRAKRVVLSDTLLDHFDPEEIEVIVAHEVGHYKMRHVWKHLAFSGLASLAAFWGIQRVLALGATRFGLMGLADPANFPLVGLVALAFGLVWMPAENGFSRRLERAADRFALAATGRAEAFIRAMEKLARVNLADPQPHPLVEFFLHSHPAIAKRIAFARALARGGGRPVVALLAVCLSGALAVGLLAGAGCAEQGSNAVAPLAVEGEGASVGRLNESGVKLLDRGEFVQAIRTFEQALAQDPQDAVLRENLGAAYVRYGESILNEGQLELAQEAFSDAVGVSSHPDEMRKHATVLLHNYGAKLFSEKQWKAAKEALLASIAYGMPHANSLEIVGDLFYQEQDLQRAQEHYQKAQALAPSEVLTAKLERLAREVPVESKFKDYPAEHFIIRYNREGAEVSYATGYAVRELLRSAHRVVGNDFLDRPDAKIPVILYTNEEYRKVRDTPHWSAGFFDGKIRLPAFGKGRDDLELKRTIYHELTHAFIFERVGERVPTWLNEGIAVYEENKVKPLNISIVERALKSGALLSLSDGSFFTYNLPQASSLEASLFYAQAYLLVKYLVERYKFYGVKKLMDTFAGNQDIVQSIRDVFKVDVATLEKRWLAWLPSQFQ